MDTTSISTWCGRGALASALTIALVIGGGRARGAHADSGGPIVGDVGASLAGGCTTVTDVEPGHHMDGSIDPTLKFTFTITNCPTDLQSGTAGAGATATARHWTATRHRAALVDAHSLFARNCAVHAGGIHLSYQPAGTKPINPSCGAGQGAAAKVNQAVGHHAFVSFKYQLSYNGSTGYAESSDQVCNSNSPCFLTYAVSGVPAASYFEADPYADDPLTAGIMSAYCTTYP